jgi:hypothetical protein
MRRLPAGKIAPAPKILFRGQTLKPFQRQGRTDLMKALAILGFSATSSCFRLHRHYAVRAESERVDSLNTEASLCFPQWHLVLTR